MEKEITITIRAKEGFLVDGLRELANEIEMCEKMPTDFETDYFDATIKAD